MQTITLPRSGQAPLQFTGEQIASADSRDPQGPCQTRWHELAIYRTESGRLVLALEYQTQWQGEHDRSHALVCETPADLLERLATVDPLSDLIGFPPGAQFDAKRLHTEKCLRQCWEGAVSELLADFPEEI